MRMHIKARAAISARHHGLLFFPLLVALVLAAPGCALFNGTATEDEKPAQEILVQAPPSYGVVTQVTAATMKDREIRLGDIAITVDLDDGSVVVVIQPEDDIYKTGDRVRVIRDGQGLVRVQIL